MGNKSIENVSAIYWQDDIIPDYPFCIPYSSALGTAELPSGVS